MPMNRTKKVEYVSEIKEMASTALSIVAIYYSRLNSVQMHELRVEARKLSVQVKVSKNTLTRIALSDGQYADIAEDMKGHVLLLFAQKEPGAAAKLAQGLIKKHDFIKVCSIGLTGSRVSPAQLEQIASLPNHEQALAMLMSTMLAPVRALATVVQETYAGLARALSQLAEKSN